MPLKLQGMRFLGHKRRRIWQREEEDRNKRVFNLKFCNFMIFNFATL